VTGVAILGCGLIGARRARALPPPFVVRTVYDVDHRRAAELAVSLTPEPDVSVSPEAALSAGVELAIVATPHNHLVPLSRMAVDAGCHVLVEKPGGRNSAELRLLRADALARQRIVRVGYNHRFHPSLLRAMELISGEQYGRLVHIRARYGHGGRPGYEREWRADPDLAGGGELLDQGVHLIDLVRRLAGDVTLAFAELRTDYWQCAVEDNAFIALRLARSGFAWLHASWTEWKNLFSFEIVLQRAKIEIAGLGGSYGTERLTLFEMLPEMGPPRTTSWEWPFRDASWEREMEDVAAELTGAAGSPTGAGLDDAIAVLEIVDQAYARSPVVATNRTVSGIDRA
jgi:predicted dehydrogenase